MTTSSDHAKASLTPFVGNGQQGARNKRKQLRGAIPYSDPTPSHPTQSRTATFPPRVHSASSSVPNSLISPLNSQGGDSANAHQTLDADVAAASRAFGDGYARRREQSQGAGAGAVCAAGNGGEGAQGVGAGGGVVAATNRRSRVTSGSWVVAETKNSYQVRATVSPAYDDGNTLIATVSNRMCDQEGNARLMAAAPAFLIFARHAAKSSDPEVATNARAVLSLVGEVA